LGGLRAVAQTISYEIVLAFILIYLVFVGKSVRFFEILSQQYGGIKFIFCGLVLRVIFFLRAVVETNRAPFDLAEGESELVSGFNVEYGGLKFALIFIAEYASIF
jgi:NADH:ubiquinone oxidoreductase subunit H